MPMTPKYVPRLRMLNRSLMQIFVRIISPPPPMPWIARAAINIPILTETPASSDPRKKIAHATSRIGLRPQMSLNLPHEGVEAAFASRYAEPIQV